MAGNIIRFSVYGDKQIMLRLKGVIPRLRRKVLMQSSREAMKPLLGAAKKRSPHKSGTLRKSLKMRAMKRNRRGLIGVHISTSDKWFGGDEFYGAFQEFGWNTGRRRAFNEWKVSAESFKRLQAVSKTYRKIKTEEDGTAWIPAWRNVKPKEIESRVNQRSLRQTQNRRYVPGKHFVEDAYISGKEIAFDLFVGGLRKRLDEIAKGGI